jgi:dTMP kinase
LPELRRGAFITLEGIDGSGKSTIARRLTDAIRALHVDVVLTREPGGTALGEQTRSILLGLGHERLCAESEALLFTASRAQLVVDVIRPALEDGKIVISDRFADSTLAYQWGGRGLDRGLLESVQQLALHEIGPDMTLLFDVAPGLALARRLQETDQVNRLDGESLAFYERVRSAYLELAAENSARWDVIDASQPSEHVWNDVVVAVNNSGHLPAYLDMTD